MQALLVTLIELLLNYKALARRGESRYLGCRANRQVKIQKKLVRGHFGGVAAPGILKNPPQP
jgi:hypothetical protein